MMRFGSVSTSWFPKNSQHAEACAKLGQHLGTRFDGLGLEKALFSKPPARRGNKISSHYDYIRVESIDDINRFPQRHDGKVIVVMKIAKLRYPKSIERIGQTRQRDVD